SRIDGDSELHDLSTGEPHRLRTHIRGIGSGRGGQDEDDLPLGRAERRCERLRLMRHHDPRPEPGPAPCEPRRQRLPPLGRGFAPRPRRLQQCRPTEDRCVQPQRPRARRRLRPRQIGLRHRPGDDLDGRDHAPRRDPGERHHGRHRDQRIDCVHGLD
ncbi:MAG: hypothetical protein ACK56I_01865, partial [bacterium]